MTLTILVKIWFCLVTHIDVNKSGFKYLCNPNLPKHRNYRVPPFRHIDLTQSPLA